MAKDDFTIEQLDRMYDEAMKWQPPAANPTVSSPPTDPREILKRLIAHKQANQQLNINQGQQIG